METKNLSEEQLDLFFTHCAEWLKSFGITDCEIIYETLSSLEPTVLAMCHLDSVAMRLTISLNPKWPAYHISKKAIKATARHEAIEALVAEIHNTVHSHIGENHWHTIRHRMIRRIDNFIRKVC